MKYIYIYIYICACVGVVREGRSDYYSVIYLQATLILLLILFYKKNLSEEKYLTAF